MHIYALVEQTTPWWGKNKQTNKQTNKQKQKKNIFFIDHTWYFYTLPLITYIVFILLSLLGFLGGKGMGPISKQTFVF